MFENLQDTCLLHNTLLSVLDRIKSQETESASRRNYEAAFVDFDFDSYTKDPENKLSELEGANIVASCMTVIAQNRIKTPLLYEQVLAEQYYVNRRCHAAMFHVVLKSNGITCAQATSYFESVGCVFPPISWKFYIMLCYLCEWSEYFVECAVQLESYILKTVVKNILKFELAEEPLRYYSRHMVLQAIIWKTFMIEDPMPYSFPNSISFSYPFVDANSGLETEDQDYWDDAFRIVSDATTLVSLVQDFPLNEEKSRLISICSFYADQFGEPDDLQIANCLKKIIIYNFPCTTNAAAILLHHPKIREKEEILQVLEEKASALKPVIIYPELIDVIVETESKEIRIRFLKLLHLILSQAMCAFSVNIYNDALKYIYLKHDMNDHFMLDNFEDELAAFSRKTMSLKEAEKFLLPLFIQSPTIILNTIIEQALVYGSKGMDVIQVLRLIPEACLYNDSLVAELNYYFSKEKLEIYEEKNLPKLIQSLMKIQAEESLLDLNEFIQKCIVENDFTQMSRLQVNYKCLIACYGFER
ncbi:uncharacterized protein TNCV_2973301 [Trichonephila clavipes]|nr:uncharacterized protein TNCV_2973301 [Trichonephila clavipes]